VDREAADRTRDAAARLLARRDHARAELTAKLARTAGPELAAAAVEEFVTAGIVDDARFAGELAAGRLARGYGPGRIAYDLHRAGVDHEVAAEALAAIDPAELEAAAARAVGARQGADAARRLAARGFGDEEWNWALPD
jgi:regulatory protein